MPLIKKSVKEKVSNHDQSEAIEKGARAFTKGLLEATKKAEKIEKHNSKKTDSKNKLGESKAVKVSEKLISKEMESQIKKSGHGPEIMKLLELVTPRVLDTLDTVAKDSVKSKSALMKSVQISKSKDIAPSKVVTDNLKDTPENTAETANKKGLVSPKVKAELKDHPHQDILTKAISSFIKLFVPHIEEVAQAKVDVAGKLAINAVETVVRNDQVKTIANVATILIDNVEKDLPTAAAPVTKAASTNAVVLDPALKQQIDSHPYRDAVKEFFKVFIPKILKTLEIVGMAVMPMLEFMAMDAIKKSVPGQTGETLAKITGGAIEDAAKITGGAIDNLTSVKVTKVEIKAIAESKNIDTVSKATAPVINLEALHIDKDAHANMPAQPVAALTPEEIPHVGMVGNTPDVL